MALRTVRRIAAAAALALPGLAAAHPGHGLDPSGASWSHALAEPEHALPLFAALCAVALVVRFRARRSRSRTR
jgi:hypothetical protein